MKIPTSSFFPKYVLAQLGVYKALANINPKDRKDYDWKELQAKI